MSDPAFESIDVDASEVDPVPPARTRFLEASRRYLFEPEVPAAHEPVPWAVREPARPWLSSRAARRSPAWPGASAPWDRR